MKTRREYWSDKTSERVVEVKISFEKLVADFIDYDFNQN